MDAVRRDEEPAPPARTDAQEEIEDREGLATALADLGARGELALHDGVCSEVRVSLPGLALERDPACRPLGAVSPDGGLVARCEDDGIEIFSDATAELVRLAPGCRPAWRPSGELTSVIDDEVVRFDGCAQPEQCTTTLIAAAELERAARLHPAVPDEIERVRALVDGVAWLSEERAAVALSIRLLGRPDRLAPLSAIAFFEEGRLESTRPSFRATGGELAASPRGTYVTRTPDVILRGDGSQLTLPPELGNARAFAWSPDERLLALAGPISVRILDVASLELHDRSRGGLRFVTIPQAAARLKWRPPHGRP